ncbi:MAG: ATP synthase F1 subunit epsilon [Verrucomicrobiales bacterium]|jgi:F-type H+-transporting ATPase subunit epsilon|nr:ATP synthase F1 subunit epsilon [Verrucomicrobiales bacterium]MDP4638408.1 ATP synthase F1 subunit epsilon [Verrucomicrobiales bacterium]MDP4793618.1 ATP synthase F1 subunit epsilon [Verrucomicrobiales bacterium]MDP4849999.1 ATP synthase F1 subunit epsilon [Verrucomicrobiales bacterium]MDP5004646.1 ATP synthase F1 subunit epsilon [Verrucomicrobiales bacterium]
MRLDIVTPEKKAFSDEIDSVVVPGAEGEMGILKSHAPIVTTLQPGELRYMKNGEETSLAIGTGIVEVSNDRVSVLTDMALGVSEIDEDAVEKAIERAQKAMTEKDLLPEDHAAAMVIMQKSLAQLHIKRRRRGI